MCTHIPGIPPSMHIAAHYKLTKQWACKDWTVISLKHPGWWDNGYIRSAVSDSYSMMRIITAISPAATNNCHGEEVFTEYLGFVQMYLLKSPVSRCKAITTGQMPSIWLKRLLLNFGQVNQLSRLVIMLDPFTGWARGLDMTSCLISVGLVVKTRDRRSITANIMMTHWCSIS